MKVMSFTDEDVSDVLQVIAGVLQLGNVNFVSAGGAQVSDKSGENLFLCTVHHSVWHMCSKEEVRI